MIYGIVIEGELLAVFNNRDEAVAQAADFLRDGNELQTEMFSDEQLIEFDNDIYIARIPKEAIQLEQ